MTDILEQRLTLCEAVAESAVGDETVILHLAQGTYYGLDEVGTRIWTMLKSGVATAEICRRVAEEFDTDISTVKADARKFIGELVSHGILQVE